MSQKLTSLSAQLKRLQVPQTNLLNIAGDKRRVSFLYDPKEAANLDSEAVFSVAMNGLEQLKLIDPETFESFELTLFSSSSISFERAIQTKQVNDKLDQELRRFLIHLSPYFMLKSAHKVFEWLVFRYQIHTYNLNELFMCVLPYHETNYFVRALQLINFQSSSLSKEHKLWEWLHENQKHGVQLASTTLATHVFSDLSFLNFVIEYLRESIEELSATSECTETQQKRWLNTLNFIFGFVTKVLLQSIKQLSLQTKLKAKQQETFLAQLLPLLFEGFKSDLIVYKQSSYLICSFLFEKFKFNSETSNKTLFALSKGLSTFRSNQMDSDEPIGEDEAENSLTDSQSLDCMKSAILAICLIVQSQQNLKANELLMSKNFLKKLVKNFQTHINVFIDTVDSLNESYKIENFLHCLFNRLIVDLVVGDQTNQEAFNSISLDLDSFNNDEAELEKKAKNEYSQLLLKLINKLDLKKSQSLIQYLITRLFESLVGQVRDENNNTLKCLKNTEGQKLPNYLVEYHLCELIYRCENKYPNQFDECLNLFLGSQETTQEQKNYLLTTISSRFATFKCRSTFKYQQVKSQRSGLNSEEQTEFNLVLSLNNSNASVRSNALEFVLKKLDSKADNLIDESFVREQLEIKFSGESSPQVLESLLKFDLKLINYFSLQELLENESYLLKLFKHDIIASNDIDLDDKSKEMLEFLHSQNKNYLPSRTKALDLIFTGLFKKCIKESSDLVETKRQFFDCFIAVMTRLFELRSVELLNHLKESKFYSEISENSEVNSKSPSSKKFYSASSISVTNLPTGIVKTSRIITKKIDRKLSRNFRLPPKNLLTLIVITKCLLERFQTEDVAEKEAEDLNELFDQYIQICVKHLLSNKHSCEKLIKHPKCFETLDLNKCNLLNIIIFEVSVRLCTQSLFLTNASFYLSLCTTILASFFENKGMKQAQKRSRFPIFEELFSKVENSNEATVHTTETKCNNFCKYSGMIDAKKKQEAVSSGLLVDLYSCLFKSINIQTSNFVNLNNKLEIEAILNQLYMHLCFVCSESDQSFVFILKKFTQSSFFNSLASSSNPSSASKPTKISSANNSNITNSFLQFAFKFLIYSHEEGSLLNEDCSETDNEERAQLLLSTAQERTIQLFNIYLKDLVAFGKNSNESSMLNALVLVLSWCLTSQAPNIRTEALDLLNKCHQLISEHIYTQANEHDDSKWLNYIKKISKHREEIQVDGASYVRSKCLNKIFSSSTEFFSIIEQLLSATTDNSSKTFFSNFLNASHSITILNKFKLCLLDLFKELKAEFKQPFMDVTMNLFLNICNYDLADDSSEKLSGLFGKVVQVLATNYFVTSKSSLYFAKNEKHFDYLIGYLNRAFQGDQKNAMELKTVKIISTFSESLINRLSDLSGNVKDFFKNLTPSMQNTMVECFFDIWLSTPTISSSLIKSCLLAFNLSASHLLNVFHNKIHLTIVKSKEEIANTTKEMKKQLKNSSMTNIVQIDWKCLKYLLDFLQHYFSFNENKMDTEEQINTETFMELIPYLFLSLETIETTLACKKDTQLELEVVLNKNQHTYLNNEDNQMQYLEIMALSCLLAIYKLNIENNKSSLSPAHFNIELLMQILHTKHSNDEDELRCNQATIDNLNVQEYVLLLLSEIATVFPDKVLEHVLIMFVFVGTKLARKDDSYSFQIIKKIIQTILPSIVNSINNSNEHVTELAKYNGSNEMEVTTSTRDVHSTSLTLTASQDRLKKTVNIVQRHQKQLPYVSSLVCKILQSFVVALPHIPAHRKTIIFSQLLEIIGLDNYLWITIVQSIDFYLVQSIDLLDFTKSLAELASKQSNTAESGKTEKHLRDTLKKTCLQSMISLHVQFEPIKVIKTSIYLVCFLNKYITSLFDTAFKLLTTTNTKNVNSATLANLNLPSNKIQNKAVYSHLACQLDNYNILQMKYLAYNLLMFISDLIISEDFLVKLATEQSRNSGDESANKQFQELLEKIMLLILKLSQIFNVFEQFAANKANKSTTSLAMINDLRKFHKAIVNKAYDLMERSISLLDSKQFISAIKLLIKHDLIQIRRRVLGLLNTKLRKYEPTEEETTLLITMLDDLLASMKLSHLSNDSMSTDAESPADQIDIEINNQTILFSIKLLCKRIGEQQPLAFVKVIKFMAENMIVKSLYLSDNEKADLNIQNINLLSSVLLCVGELCLKLKSTALVYLNKIMTFTLEIVDVIRKKTGHFEENSTKDMDVEYLKNAGNVNKSGGVNKNYELLILSCVTCMLKIVQNMASFISPFLPRMMYVTCSLSRLISSAANQDRQGNSSLAYPQIEIKLAQLRSSMATLIPLRLLAPILNDQSNLVENFNKKTPYSMTTNNIEYYMNMVIMAIRHVNQEDLLSNIRLIRSMFMNLFDFRTMIVSWYEANNKDKNEQFYENVCKYEDHIIDAFSELIFKLSEDLFKPIFFKLYEWATANEPPKDRLITFYRTTLKLSAKLKNLFVLFASQFLVNASTTLELLNLSKTKNAFFGKKYGKKDELLLYSIIGTLSNVFLNDSQKSFANKDCFKLLIQPLVDQLDNEIEYESYNTYITKHLAPCIANLASSCVQDDSLCRKFNYQILLKTKSGSVHVRIAALNVLNLFSKKIGDIYNSYLSETVPFLAELMEDPIEEVEEKVQELIKELEEMLGESLQGHFV